MSVPSLSAHVPHSEVPRHPSPSRATMNGQVKHDESSAPRLHAVMPKSQGTFMHEDSAGTPSRPASHPTFMSEATLAPLHSR